MMTLNRKLIVVLPAYNEAENIQGLLDGFTGLSEVIDRLQLILVDDGSNDDTVFLANPFKGILNLEIISLPSNKGLPGALRTGFQRAVEITGDKDTIVTMDADNTHPPQQILLLDSEILNGFDVVIASRYQSGARVEGVSGFRRFLSFGASFLYRLFLPFDGVRDYSSGFRAFRSGALRDTLEKEADRIFSLRGFACNTALLLAMRRRLGIRANEIPIDLRYQQKRGVSKMKVGSTVIESLKLLVFELFASRN
ncbi:MAG TPA: glycosyltransferase [Oligoflexia bacterium]|nr:glycosyltransferase [Oligoflexia bacterium]HMP49551.1 glycosyltransferase [Oligoflexia bacterium]